MLAVRHHPIVMVSALAVIALAPGRAKAQQAADGTPPTSSELKTAPAAPAKDQPRPQKPGAPMGAGAKDWQPPGPDGVVRPAQAFPPERIQAPERLPDAKPAPKDDPRGVEERGEGVEADK